MTHADSTPSSRAFDLAYQNIQSISRAQRFYLSILLVYLCAVWGWYFVGGGDSVTVQVVGITLKAAGLWIITPGITTLLTLALIGSVGAAGPALKRLNQAAAREPNLAAIHCGLIFYELDTHKNIFDYFNFLRIDPEKPLNLDPRRRFEPRHFLYPLLYVVSIRTTWTAISKTYVSADFSRELIHPNRFLAYGMICLFLQGIFSIRPCYRAACRFFGIRTMHVYEE